MIPSKNIHIIPTDQPSRVYIVNSINKLDWSEGYLQQVDGATNQNIYITSDEEIKEGDYYITPNNTVLKALGPMLINVEDYKKIILTTDQNLIADGVQSIDDEFLEWFVKNPSCEEVEVSEDYFKPSNIVYGHDTEPYKIIIPKEEPKQETLESNKTTAIRFLEWYRRKGVIYQFQAYHIQGSDETIYLNSDQLFEIFKKELYEK
jgi:hypothetical protein